jgi:hypothetical protein
MADAIDASPKQISKRRNYGLKMANRAGQLNTVIRTFTNEIQAQIAQAVLDANGIDSNLIRDDAGGMMPWLQTLHPIRLVVREADSAEAVDLLDSPPPLPPPTLSDQ